MEVRDNQIIKLKGDRNHPANQGRLCTKGNSCAEILTKKGRLENAQFRDRTTNALKVTTSAEAIQITANKLKELIAQHGPEAVSLYVSGQMSMEAQYLANKLAKGFIRTPYIESNSRLCMSSASTGYKLSLGADAPPGSYDDMDHTNLFLVMGSNMADCHPILHLRMLDRMKAGAKCIVVDPRRTTTADKADLFLQIKPGTDVALLNGLLYLLIEMDAIDHQFIKLYTEGWQELKALAEEYPPAYVSQITGISETQLKQAANMIAESPNWITCWMVGLNQSTHGTWNTNAICNLHLATGAICRTGSGPLSLTGQSNAMGGRDMGYMGIGLPGQRSIASPEDRAFVEKLWNIPEGSLREDTHEGAVSMMDKMKAGEIKACWIIYSNPVASMPNRQQTIEALKAAELVIVQDAMAESDTSPYADVLLPAALWVEGEGTMVNSERNVTLMEKAVEPLGNAMPDWQWIAEIACAMGYESAFSYESASDIFEEIKQANNPRTGYDLRGASYDRLRETPIQWPCGPSSASRNPIRYVTSDVPEGIENGFQFPTSTGKAHFFARPHMESNELPNDQFPFLLNTGRVQHQWHTATKTGKIEKLNKLNPGPFVEIHPDDATMLGIESEDQVQLSSMRGNAILPALVTDRVQKGCCFSPIHWNDIFGEKLAINALTNDAVDPLSLQPELKSCAIQLQLHAKAEKKIENTVDSEQLSSQAIAKAVQFSDLVLTPPSLSNEEELYLQGFMAGLSQDQSQQGVPVLPESAPVSDSVRLWYNGLLAGCFSRTMSAGQNRGKITLLWASQTGNAEDLAELYATQWKEEGFQVELLEMNDFTPDNLAQRELVFFVTSTFGDGDPPDNGTDFWQRLNDHNDFDFSALRFSVLALGDSSYAQFCGFGDKLHKRLETLGAQSLTELKRCDSDFEEDSDSWLNDINHILTSHFGESPNSSIHTATTKKKALYDRKHPLPAKLVENRLLDGSGSEKEVRHFAFAINDGRFTYEAGDALGVWPSNSDQQAQQIIDQLKLESETPITLKSGAESTLFSALKNEFDLSTPTRDQIHQLATSTGNRDLLALLDEHRNDELNHWLWGKQIIDLLRACPGELSAEVLIDWLRPMQPRSYSISSSPKAHPDQVHLTVSIVRYLQDQEQRGGICSTFLADRAENSDVPIFIKSSKHFRVPTDSDTPIIMVGPGTGIAPFRAFLQERMATQASGKNWLFFGEQRAKSNFYYADEIAQFQKAGYLSNLDTAFSRDQAEKIYVQHRMLEKGKELWQWLEEGAHFYVCGDASRMAKDVDNALITIAQQHGALSSEDAQDYIQQLSKNNRYVRDVY